MCVCVCVHVYPSGSSQVCYFIYATFPPFTLSYNRASAYGQCWKREGEQLLLINCDTAQYFPQEYEINATEINLASLILAREPSI